VIFIAILPEGAPAPDEEFCPAELCVKAVFFFFGRLEDLRKLVEGADGADGTEGTEGTVGERRLHEAELEDSGAMLRWPGTELSSLLSSSSPGSMRSECLRLPTEEAEPTAVSTSISSLSFPTVGICIVDDAVIAQSRSLP